MRMTGGEKWTGMWKNGKKHGEGTKTSEDGKQLKGVWCEGERKEWIDVDSENKALNRFL